MLTEVTDETLPDWTPYIGSCGRRYEEPKCTGMTSVDCLQFLWGRQISRLTMGYIHALRPSMIRICRGEITCDSVPWRVTIYLDDHDTIYKIDQEAEVAGGSGYELRRAFNKFYKTNPID